MVLAHARNTNKLEPIEVVPPMTGSVVKVNNRLGAQRAASPPGDPMYTQNKTMVTARMRRTKHLHYFVAHVAGGAADGLTLLPRSVSRSAEHLRWVKAAKTNATIDILVDTADLEARLDKAETSYDECA